MEELKNTDKKGISTKRKIGKTTYEVVVHFNENATETMQDKLTRIMLRELRRKSDEKKDDFDINGKIKCPLFGEEESLDREEKIKRKT